ncbi:preprotein translocase subunit SecA [Patescibacteria group bacterium]|nr:preprotein translocase subunit SecA [Patescibacteria group bacterium]
MFQKLRGLFDSNQKDLSKFQATVDLINNLEPGVSKLKDNQLKAEIGKLKKELSQGKTLDDILPQVYALTREAAKRTTSMRAFDVQLMAAIAFHQGKIAEQKTGEGKTLSAILAIALNALTGRGVHLVTVNDYLAQRDAGWMAPAFHLLGLSTGVIYSGKGDQPASIYDPDYQDKTHHDKRLHNLRPCSRREAYKADITYGTNNEFGFDYLRDNMARSLEGQVQREHHFAIVDEVDSILIDEARTPLIISAPDSEPTQKYYQFSQLITSLSKDTDYDLDEKQRTVNLTDHGLRKVEKILKVENLYEQDYKTLHHIEQALKSRTLFAKDKDYVVKDDQIIIVDEHTGRLMYGRRYSDGLHQAIEAKEGVKIQQESKTLATISLQNYFRMYQKLAGMTGTAVTEKVEFKKIYDLDVVVIPTNKPVKRIDSQDIVYKTQAAKYSKIVQEIMERNKKGQPILIGTKSIDQNQIITQFLKKKRVKHQVLNAKNHENEAEIISQAGRVGGVTVATNIAGRGVDIVLGGDPSGRTKADWQKEHQKVVELGGLHIIGAVRHESRRIDNQFRGRSGRQGDPGSSRFYVSLGDDIMRIFGGDRVSRLMDLLKVPEDQPLEAGMVSKAIETAQAKVESFHFDQRKNVVEYDGVLNKHRDIFYKKRQQILEKINDSSGLKQETDELLAQEVDNLLVPYFDKLTKDDADRLIKEFQLILPLHPQSADPLEKRLVGQTPEEINKLFNNIVTQARKEQELGLGKETTREAEKFVQLGTYDELWMQHLDTLDSLRDGIGLRGYAQKDPVVEYKKEAYSLFESLLNKMDSQIARRIFRIQARPATPPPTPSTEVAKPKKLGRNDPCWCGSGKKFKTCHYPQTA